MSRASLIDRPVVRWLPLALAAVVGFWATWVLYFGAALIGPVGGPLGALVGDALLGAGGKADAGEVLASYPPLSLMPLIAVQAVTGLEGFGAAHLLSVVLASGLAALWLRGLLLAKYQPLAASAITLLLCANPLFMMAMAEGPELMLTVTAAYCFAIGAFAVRARGGVNDLMLCSGSLVLMAFAGQSGFLLMVATLPFLSLVMPTDIRARSWVNVYVVLLFPLVFILLGFMLVNWMMLHDPLAFVRPQIEASGEWFSGSWRLATGEIVSAVASAPILAGLFIFARGRGPIQSIALAMLGTVMLLALLTLETGLGLSLAAALAPATGLAAAAAMRWPLQRHRPLRVLLMLTLGALGSATAVYAERYAMTSGSELRDDRQVAADRELGEFLRGRSGVMIDAAVHPQVVAARGSAEGLITASDTAFDIAMLRRRADRAALEVAVQRPDASRNADMIGRILPNFYQGGEAGFALIYDRDGWRVWSKRTGAPQGGTETP